MPTPGADMQQRKSGVGVSVPIKIIASCKGILLSQAMSPFHGYV